MHYNKIMDILLIIVGAFGLVSYIITDIYGTNKIDSIFIVMGLILILIGTNELNHKELMDKLNEPPGTIRSD